jgi:hypothetical protein
MLVEAELGMRVQVAANAGEIVGPAAYAGDGVGSHSGRIMPQTQR